MQEINYQSKLFYRNMDPKDLPPKSTDPNSPYIQLRNWEIEKCTYGVNVNGIPIPGTLYYQYNHCVMSYEELDPITLKPRMQIAPPLLRDTDWQIHTGMQAAADASLGFLIASARQIGKTEVLVCLGTHELSINKGAEVVALFSSDKDRQTFVKKLRLQLSYNTEFLRLNSIDKDFSKEFIRFGYKEKDNTDRIFSSLYLYNTDEGQNTEVSAGKTITLYLFDEIAKAPMNAVHEAVIPAIQSQYAGFDGLKARMFHCMTGGEAKKFGDAKAIFFNPRDSKFLPFDDDQTGFFLDATYKSAAKKKTTFGDYIFQLYGKRFENDELDFMEFLERDMDLAHKLIQKELEEGKRKGIVAYNKRRMYNPLKKSDVFLSGEDNIFGVFASEIEKVRHYILNDLIKSFKKVDMERNKETNQVTVTPSLKPILTDFPLPSSITPEELDTAIVILAEPKEVAGTKLYVQGADLINTNTSLTSPSLGSFYIMQKDTDDYTDPWNGRVVAFYNGRKDLTDLKEKLLCTLLFYGADKGAITLLHEAANDTLTQQFSEENFGHFLEDTYQFAREIKSDTKATNNKGVRPTPANQSYMIDRTMDYLSEDIGEGKLGIWRIPDPYLLAQFASFTELAVADAIVGFGHTVMHYYKEKKFGAAKSRNRFNSENPQDKSQSKTYRRSALGQSRGGRTSSGRRRAI